MNSADSPATTWLNARTIQTRLGDPRMKIMIATMLGIILMLQPTYAVARTASKDKDEDRLRDCGAVVNEILNVPDDIPQDLLNKADCVVVYPSVLKAAFVIGGSYGRGARTCRKGK